MSAQFQRRTILVKRSLQLRYMGLVLMAALAAAVLVGGGVYYTLARHVLFDNPMLTPVMSKIHHTILVQITLYFGIITILAAIVSHRIAGPLYRFEQSAQAFSDGDLTHRVILRTGDELRELQEAFNEMAVSLQTRVQKDRNLAHRIGAKLDEISAKVDGQARLDLAALKEEVGHLTQEFKL